jgi:hypothetical protein
VWLHDDSSDYESTASYDLENVPEAKKSQVVSLVIETTNAEILLMYSSFKRTCRVFCYVFRFLNNSRCSKENKCTGPLTAEEYHQTTLKIVRVIQHKKYKADVDDLKKDSAINNSLKLKNLHPFLNSDELLRVGGRLMNVDITYDEHLIILPPEHHIMKLLVIEEHQRLLHAGAQLVLASLRAKFWIPTGCNVVRHVLNKCLQCLKLRNQASTHLMGQLLGCRVQQSMPFTHCGIDYGGPISIKNGGRRSKSVQKAYIALFICMSIKAIHLELVSDLTTEAFMAALRRFVSRRGRPFSIHSDKRTNFVGAKNELHKVLHDVQLKDAVYSFTSSEGIDWKFIPPHAPHFGGLFDSRALLRIFLRELGLEWGPLSLVIG